MRIENNCCYVPRQIFKVFPGKFLEVGIFHEKCMKTKEFPFSPKGLSKMKEFEGLREAECNCCYAPRQIFDVKFYVADCKKLLLCHETIIFNVKFYTADWKKLLLCPETNIRCKILHCGQKKIVVMPRDKYSGFSLVNV